MLACAQHQQPSAPSRTLRDIATSRLAWREENHGEPLGHNHGREEQSQQYALHGHQPAADDKRIMIRRNDAPCVGPGSASVFLQMGEK
jgi:hypothetical protein